MAHSLCMHKQTRARAHAYRKMKYFFSTATVVSRTRLNIKLCIHCLSCLHIFVATLNAQWPVTKTPNVSRQEQNQCKTESGTQRITCVISIFRRGVNEFFALLRCYASYMGTWYRRFGATSRSYLQGPSRPRIFLKMGSITNYHSTLHNIPEERRFHNEQYEY